MPSGIGDVDFSNPNVKVFTRGLKQTVKALEAAGVDAQDMKSVFERAGQVVYRAVEPPVKSGKLAASIRVTKAKNKAAIKAGGARVPYAARVHFGDATVLENGKRVAVKRGVHTKADFSKSGIRHKGNPFFLRAVKEKRQEVLTIIIDGLTDLFKKHDLGDPPIRVTSYVPKSK